MRMGAEARMCRVAYHDKDQPNSIAWCPGYPDGLFDISPLYASIDSARGGRRNQE
jgi:hypothetical protein